ncbi:MAG TPA: L,D-transpeptidase family protein [Gaiellales bacterium]|jgi:peptidoglycan hydrolase-like protein with peptidoglycan-binding domain|nr:L,D-transpeptidase family protein [Gaiellales bacterium]
MRRRSLVIGAVAAGVLVTAVGALAVWSYAERPLVSGAPRQWYRTPAPQVLVPVEHSGSLADLRASVDGQDAAAKLRRTGGGLELELNGLADGTHRVRVQASPGRVFGDSVDEDFAIHVDTHRPELALNEAPSGWQPVSELSGRVEPGSTLALSYRGKQVVLHPRTTTFALDPKLPDGRTTVKLIASDRAGNSSVITRTVAVDRTAPRVHVDRVPSVLGTAHPTLRGSIDDASPVSVQALLDGDSVALRGPGGNALLGGAAVSGRFSLPLQHLAQGVHTLSITATDGAGNTTTTKAGPFTVDSTEKLRPSTVLALGARGKDVVQLERRLKSFGTYHGPFTRFFNARTEAAVSAFQRLHKLPVTGIATPAVLQLSEERIVVHLSRFRVTLIRDGKRIFSAPIAIGMAAHPTPTGTYEVIAKIRNPTWVPPNSPWAAGLEAIPPGVNNPLGTRWIGTSAPNIGFHATPADYSVGHAASHGCMRMHRADVERLYDLIRVGTPVDIEL